MFIKVLLIIGVILYAAFNLITAKLMSAKEMHHEFVCDQCTVGKIFANVFYAPAWLLKGLRFLVVAMIK